VLVYLAGWLVAYVLVLLLKRGGWFGGTAAALLVAVLILVVGAVATTVGLAGSDLQRRLMLFLPFLAFEWLALSAVRRRATGAERLMSAQYGEGGVDLRASVSRWLDEVARLNPLPDGCSAVVFGLFESELGYQAYAAGTSKYDLLDPDWAADARFRFHPGFLDSVSPGQMDQREYQSRFAGVISGIIGDGSNRLLTLVPHVSVGFDDMELTHLK